MPPVILALAKGVAQRMLVAGATSYFQQYGSRNVGPGRSAHRYQPEAQEFANRTQTATAAVAGFAAALTKIPSKIEAMGESLINAQAGHAAYNGRFAQSMATLEIGRFRRNVEMAQGTAGTFSALTNSQDRLERALLPLKQLSQNLSNLIQTGGNSAVAGTIDYLSKFGEANKSMEPAWIKGFRLAMEAAINAANGQPQTPYVIEMMRNMADRERRRPPI